MNRIVAAPLVVFAVWLGLADAVLADNVPGSIPKPPPPNLMKIGFVQGGKKMELAIPMVIGGKEVEKSGVVSERWTILPGLVLKSERPPANRVVELYQGKGAQRSLLLLVNVKYFRNRDGYWQPHFQPNEVPLVAPDGKGGWRPIPQAQSRSGLLVLHGISLPNAEGFYPTLEFGLTIGRASIDSWVVN